MAVALSPAATSLRFKSFSAVRFLSFYRKPTTVIPTLPSAIRHFRPHSTPFRLHSHRRRRSFCSIISAALSSCEATKTEAFVNKESGVGSGLFVLRAVSLLLRLMMDLVFVMSSDAEGYNQVESGLISTGASVWVQGVLVKSQGSKEKVELKVEKLVLVGTSDTSFPIQKKRVSREFLRTKAHLRPRTNTFGAVARVRNALAYATHRFFQENGFVWVSSPIITASDCEGAGEQFCVTTLIPSFREVTDSPVTAIPRTEDGSIDWSQYFFGKPAFLTVSGQLNGETYATALSDVYMFGPTFRAENSNTSRHLAEFWMIEPELAFTDLDDDMACATAYLQYVVQYVLENCKEDMDFFNTWIEKGIISRLSVKWRCDLQSEHEHYITEQAFAGCPVIIRDYPKENDDEKTVAAMDMLVPQVG
ncbi:hypothetical protein ACH5RR_040224 [Cinchona calisaya]|uniref:Aminoacyl-transfer RNA synthetases class-II family profile domain-containing protein n=1 Tax=Cinchona calisaya TaxID=153742 RepID=A0ABD2XVD2_9GENT